MKCGKGVHWLDLCNDCYRRWRDWAVDYAGFTEYSRPDACARCTEDETRRREHRAATAFINAAQEAR